MPTETYAGRIAIEHAQLAKRTEKLLFFIAKDDTYNHLPEKDKMLLCRQRDIMLEYISVLEDRMALIPDALFTNRRPESYAAPTD